MSGGEGRKVDNVDMKQQETRLNCNDVLASELVHNCIEQCLKLYMSQEEAANTLSIQKNIEPRITEAVWQRLEEQNQEFFKAYYLKLMVKDQIVEFNKLLAEQVDLMRRTGLVSVPSMPISNGSNISSIQHGHRAGENPGCALGPNDMHRPMVVVQQGHRAGENPGRSLGNDMHRPMVAVQQVPRAGENPGCALGQNDMHRPMLTNFPNAFMNHGPTMNPCMQSSHGMSIHGKGMDVPSNMMLAQSTSMGIRPTLNGGTIKREADYATSPFNYAAASHFVGSQSAMADASMPSFSTVDSSLQSLNASLLDTDASSFGYLGQLPQNFSLPNMTSEISTNPDILNGYSEAPFLASNSNNMFDPRGNMGRFG